MACYFLSQKDLSPNELLGTLFVSLGEKSSVSVALSGKLARCGLELQNVIDLLSKPLVSSKRQPKRHSVKRDISPAMHLHARAISVDSNVGMEAAGGFNSEVT